MEFALVGRVGEETLLGALEGATVVVVIWWVRVVVIWWVCVLVVVVVVVRIGCAGHMRFVNDNIGTIDCEN